MAGGAKRFLVEDSVDNSLIRERDKLTADKRRALRLAVRLDRRRVTCRNFVAVGASLTTYDKVLFPFLSGKPYHRIKTSG